MVIPVAAGLIVMVNDNRLVGRDPGGHDRRGLLMCVSVGDDRPKDGPAGDTAGALHMWNLHQDKAVYELNARVVRR